MFASIEIKVPLFGLALPELDIARAVVEGLPTETRAELRGVRLLIRNRPRLADFVRGCGLRQWGCFWGARPVDDDEIAGGELPSAAGPTGEIVLFRRNYPQRAEVLRDLLLHEIDHVLGYDETEARPVQGKPSC